jgi:hypothetical protein
VLVTANDGRELLNSAMNESMSGHMSAEYTPGAGEFEVIGSN